MKHLSILTLLILTLLSCNKEKKSDKKGLKMQTFVTELSSYAKGIDNNFIIIPQNGSELAFNNLAQDEGVNTSYLEAIDGFGIEELFYDSNGNLNPDQERLTMLKELKDHKPVLVADYVTDSSKYNNAVSLNLAEEFICFPRQKENYNYEEIPLEIINENDNDINTLADAQNYLYLIGNANFSTKLELVSYLNTTNYDIILLDLWFKDEMFARGDLAQLKTKANGGKRLVISYINVGAAENYRYYWKEKWKLHRPGWLKKPYEGYEDEIWVKFWKKEWKEIIYGNDDSYMKKIIDADFDGAYLDNVEAFYFLYFD